MTDASAPVVLAINLRQDDQGDWSATVFGYECTKYFYAGSLPAVLLKVAAHAEGNAEFGRQRPTETREQIIDNCSRQQCEDDA